MENVQLEVYIEPEPELWSGPFVSARFYCSARAAATRNVAGFTTVDWNSLFTLSDLRSRLVPTIHCAEFTLH